MAKKVTSTLRSGTGKGFTRVIKMVKSTKSGAYIFKESTVHNSHVQDYLKQKEA